MKYLYLFGIAVCILVLFSCSHNDAPPSTTESGTATASLTEERPNENDRPIIDNVYNKIYSQDRDYFLAYYSNGDMTELGLFHFSDGYNILLMNVSEGQDSHNKCCLDSNALYKIEYPFLYRYDIKSENVQASAASFSLAELKCDDGFDKFEAVTCRDGILYFQVERYVSPGNYKTETYAADVQNNNIEAVNNDDVPSDYRQFNVDEFIPRLEAACQTDVKDLPVFKSSIRLNRYGKIESFLIESNKNGAPVNIVVSFGAGEDISIDCLPISQQSESPQKTVSIASFLHFISNYISSEHFIQNDCSFYFVDYNDPASLESYNITDAELNRAIRKAADYGYQEIKESCVLIIPFKEGETSVPVLDNIKLIPLV